MWYEAVHARCGSVGIALATSSISRGKTNCAKISIAMCGNYPKGCTGRSIILIVWNVLLKFTKSYTHS